MQDKKVLIKEFYNSYIEEWEKYPRIDVRKQYLELLDFSTIKNNQNNNLKILDVGCGCGHDAVLLSEILKNNNIANFKGLGIDFSHKAIENASNKSLLQNWIFSSIDFLDTINEFGFDIVVCSMVVMHYQDLNQILGILASFLNENGKLLLVTNNPYLVSYEYNISYQREKSYEHIFSIANSSEKVRADKYLHSISAYFQAAKEVSLELESYKEILSYNSDTCLYNDKSNNKLDFPNFIAMLFKK